MESDKLQEAKKELESAKQRSQITEEKRRAANEALESYRKNPYIIVTPELKSSAIKKLEQKKTT